MVAATAGPYYFGCVAEQTAEPHGGASGATGEESGEFVCSVEQAHGQAYR